MESLYARYLPDAIALAYYESSSRDEDEIDILEHFREKRIINKNGNLTEWLKIGFSELKAYLDTYFWTENDNISSAFRESYAI